MTIKKSTGEKSPVDLRSYLVFYMNRSHTSRHLITELVGDDAVDLPLSL